MQTNSIPIIDYLPPKYQGTAILFFVLLPYATRAYHAIITGGGLKGMWSAIWFGTNAPKQLAAPADKNDL